MNYVNVYSTAALAHGKGSLEMEMQKHVAFLQNCLFPEQYVYWVRNDGLTAVQSSILPRKF